MLGCKEERAMFLAQIAISSTHLLRSHQWYCEALGFVPAGELRHREVPGRGKVSGLPEASLDVWCLMGGLDWMQFEMFEFQKPRMRQMPPDWMPADIGYSMIGLAVNDFDLAVRRIRRTSGRLITPPLGPLGDRRVCLRDSDGVLIEIRERDIFPQSRGVVPRPWEPLVQFVTLSVWDLDEARRFWVEGLGLREADIIIHSPADEALWGFTGVSRRSAVISAGTAFIELVEYREPIGRSRTAGYLFSDQGILNVALGTSEDELFLSTYTRAIQAGYQANSEPYEETGAKVVYLKDAMGNSVELLYVSADAMSLMGFIPNERGERPT
jgi:catechol 2,3-dioxygenase-like lactoylglutathione lyase family enzyme